MRTRRTLLDRTQKRNKWDAVRQQWPVAEDHIRAELKRLARQVRGLVGLGVEGKKSGAILRRDVLDLIEAAKR